MSAAEKLSLILVLHGAAKEEDREVLAFMFFQIFALVQQIVVLAVIAAVLGSFPQVFLFVLFFASLKRFAGGAHADKHWTCLTLFSALTVSVCLLSKYVVAPPHIAIGVSVVSLILVLLRSPVIHPNNPKPKRRQRKMRKVSICIAVIQMALIALGSLYNPALALPSAMGGFGAAIALVFPMPSESDGA